MSSWSASTKACGATGRLPAWQGARAVRTRVGHSYIKAQMAEHSALFGGEHSAHYYFRDFWGADSGMLAALHVLAALAEQDAPLSEMMAAYDRYADALCLGQALATPDPAVMRDAYGGMARVMLNFDRAPRAESLFAEAVRLPVRPDRIVRRALDAGLQHRGARHADVL